MNATANDPLETLARPAQSGGDSAADGASILSIRNLVVEFSSRDANGRRRVARVLNSVDLDVGTGRIVGLIG